MAAGSLRLRLLAGASVAIFVSLAVSWFAMTWLFERHIERREASELTRTGLMLVAGLGIDAAGAPTLEQTPGDPRLLQPAGGFYWQVTTSRGAVRSRSLWDQALTPARAEASGWRTRTAAGPFGQRLLVVERSVQPARTQTRALVQVASDTRALVTARREFGQELALFLAGLWAVLSLAALVQVRLGLAPLAGLRGDLQRLRRNPSARLAGERPREVAPLADAINALADARQRDVERARRRAADLAHSLKTPLSALSAQSRRAREAGAAEAADGLDRAIAAVGAALEAELARARASASRDTPQEPVSRPAAVAERLIEVLERTADGERLVFDQQIAPDLRIPAPGDALTEVMGALMENAARHARRQMRLSGEAAGGRVRVTIEDDGPGLETERAEAALIRGGRLDEAGPGHGLGLAIVRDLVAATDGQLELDRAPLGGLRVTLSWADQPPAG